MDHKLAQMVLESRVMPHGSRGLASLLETELVHPLVDLKQGIVVFFACGDVRAC